MKTLKVAICAIFVLFAGFVFSACGEKKDFNVNNIVINATEFEYDGNPHGVDVSYTGTNVSVSYSLEKNGNYVALNNFVKDAGRYDVYFKLSAKGYNDYVSSEPIEVNILPRELIIVVEDLNFVKSAITPINPGFMMSGLVEGDDLGLELNISGDFSDSTCNYGDEFEMFYTIENDNYNLNCQSATLKITDYAKTVKANGDVVNYYDSIQEAINNVNADERVVIDADNYIKNMIDVTKSVVIDGQGKYTIYAHAESANLVTARKMISVTTAGVELTLKDVIVDAGQKCRVVYVSAGKLIVDGAIIQNGKTSDSYIGGVYITGTASFEMTSGRITNNYCSDSYSDDLYLQFSADLWIGSEAVGALSSVTGGEIGNVFVNANEYSKDNAGFTLDGGKIGNIYVEYNNEKAARFDYISGEIGSLYVSTPVTGIADNGAEPVEGTTYYGGSRELIM